MSEHIDNVKSDREAWKSTALRMREQRDYYAGVIEEIATLNHETCEDHGAACEGDLNCWVQYARHALDARPWMQPHPAQSSTAASELAGGETPRPTADLPAALDALADARAAARDST